jgi:dTDP-4-amino-4,6-dideoxygalactose transaminase
MSLVILARSMGSPYRVEFNKPTVEGRELFYIAQSVLALRMSGSGPFSARVREILREQTGSRQVCLTPSCTAALEMAAVLCNVEPGDEVVLPSFTFVSTANPFILRGARPVFVDVREDTLNIDERKIPAALSPKTRAIVPVHYAGVPCDMDPILALARPRGIHVVEDAAQAVGSSYRGKACGTIGVMGTWSFHETKVFYCGEGGALSVNDPVLERRAEVVAEKGTNRAEFFRGEVDKYTWREVGSSYLMADICAAFLAGQLERWDDILERRRRTYERYQERLAPLVGRGDVRLPVVPGYARTNHHIFFLIANDPDERARLITHAKERGVQLIFHYVPLHDSPFGRRFGQGHGDLPRTEDLAARLVRLPLHNNMTREDADLVCDAILGFYGVH